MNVYRQLAEGGGFNLPFLVHLSSPDNAMNIYLINDNQDMTYGGQVYSASNFTYSPLLLMARYETSKCLPA